MSSTDASLYERLGKKPGIEQIASDIWDNHISNPIVKNRCAGFGGPEEYTGMDMISSHKGMNINEAEFIAVCDDVLKALDKNKAGQREKDEVLCILYSMKAEIVHL
jgi:hemoglobin